MKIKDILNIKNIASFVEGHIKFFYYKMIEMPQHQQEQVMYRLEKCKDDCVPQGKCIICSCPTEKKVFVNETCNPDRFPNMMSKQEWDEFKKENGIIRK